MRRLRAIVFIALTFCLNAGAEVLSNGRMSVDIASDGSLKSLRNDITGHDYASGGYLWRLYYDCPQEKEIQVTAEGQSPQVCCCGDTLFVRYDRLRGRSGEPLGMSLTLRIVLEQDKVRFGCSMANNEPHTVIREFQYPLVRGIRLPKDHKLFTSEAGGKLYSDPVAKVNTLAASPYKKPEQYFRQLDVKYGAKVFMNCFGLFGENQGLYFGSHDDSFQDTWQGMRVYRDEKGRFTQLECGFFKYPHCFCGHSWACDANVVTPYNGSWHTASRIYRDWVDTWYDHRPTPLWVRNLRSWQRVIFKHQYGEYFFKYTDLYSKVKEAGDAAGADAVFMFGWWAEGMDHGNPDYSPDHSQGGDAALKDAIERFQADGRHHLILYYNGKLIDRESSFYRSGKGPEVCRHDNTGSEILERYKFTGQGTWLGEYDQRTFAVATMNDPQWNTVLCGLQDRAYGLGAHSVFFDQLGYVEKESTDWNTSGEYPVPDVYGIARRMQCLKMLRDRYAQKDPDFALGVEGTVDALAQYCDYTHGYPENSDPCRWLNFFRYTFPDIVFTDRGLRDDSDVPRRVNMTLLDGQRNDIEIFRCRDIISACPVYQKYLGAANAIKAKYAEILLLGSYNDALGFSCSNSRVEAKSFVSGDRIAIVVANQNSDRTLRARIRVPGCHYVESSVLGKARVGRWGRRVRLGRYDLAVLIYEKNK